MIEFDTSSKGMSVKYGFTIPKDVVEEIFPDITVNWCFYHQHFVAASETASQLAMYQELMDVMAAKLQEWSMIVQNAIMQQRQNERTKASLLGGS